MCKEHVVITVSPTSFHTSSFQEMSYHPGSNLAGEDGYGLKGMNPETTSTDRSTSTLHSTSMTRTCPTTDPFSTFPEDDSESGKSRYLMRYLKLACRGFYGWVFCKCDNAVQGVQF